MRKHVSRCLGICVLTLLMVSGASAQDAIDMNPAQLTVSATRNQLVERTLVIQTSTSLASVKLLSSDLVDTKGQALFPAKAIAIGPSIPDVSAGDIATVPIQFDLHDIASGSYSGEIVLSYQDGSRVIPVHVTIKDPIWWPLGVLIIGVVLGLFVTIYRTKGQPRDEILVQLGQIRTQMKVDQQLHTQGKAFVNRLEAALVDAEVALEGRKWDDAHQALAKAGAIWQRWRRGRPDWLVQLTAFENLMDKLHQINPDGTVRFISQIAQSAEDAFRGAPDLDEPERFRQQIAPFVEQTNLYVALRTRLQHLTSLGGGARAQADILSQRLANMLPSQAQDLQELQNEMIAALRKYRMSKLNLALAKLEELHKRLPDNTRAEWTDGAQEYRARIQTSKLEEDAVYVELQSELTESWRQARESVGIRETTTEEAQPFSAPLNDLVKSLVSDESTSLTQLPEARVLSLTQEIPHAGRRLRVFTFITYGVAVILLALAGFVEIYLTRPDFGANGVGDYFALLAWGFGAEATRSAIADMMQSWGLIQR